MSSPVKVRSVRPWLLMLAVIIGFPSTERLVELPLRVLAAPESIERVVADVAAALLVGLLTFVLSRRSQRLSASRQRILEELQSVSVRYQQLAENASDVVYTAGIDRLTTWVSPAASRILGWTSDEMLGRTIDSFMHPDDRASTEEVRRRIYSGLPFAMPAGGLIMRFAMKTGDYRWMSIRIHHVTDDAGKHIGVVGGLTVVDELVHAREEAERQQTLMRLVSDAMFDPQALMLVVRDETGRPVDFTLLQVNLAMCNYLQQPAETLVGRRFLDVASQMRASPLFERYLQAADAEEPLSLRGFAAPSYPTGSTGYFDVRAVQVGGDRIAITWRNVTSEREIAMRLEASERLFTQIAESSEDVILMSSAAMELRWVSPSSERTLGWTPQELTGHTGMEFIHPDDLAALQQAVAHSTATGEAIRPRFRCRRPDGAYRWMEATGRPVDDDGTGKPGGVAVLRDIEAEIEVQQRLERRATFDDLTGAVMREVAFQRMGAVAARVSDPGAAVLYIDIDNFKLVNDGLGHAAGDAVLRTLVHRMRAGVRSLDTVARMGGDEFLILLDGVRDLDRALAFARKVASACAVPVQTPRGEVTVTSSIGVALLGRHDNVDDVLARADRAMYEAKKSGRNQVAALSAP